MSPAFESVTMNTPGPTNLMDSPRHQMDGPGAGDARAGQSETEAKRNIVEAVKTTAKRLGNRPAACRKYHIHPAILESYTEQTLFEAMKGVHAGPVSSAAELRAEELVVIRPVEAYANASSARPAKAS